MYVYRSFMWAWYMGVLTLWSFCKVMIHPDEISCLYTPLTPKSQTKSSIHWLYHDNSCISVLSLGGMENVPWTVWHHDYHQVGHFVCLTSDRGYCWRDKAHIIQPFKKRNHIRSGKFEKEFPYIYTCQKSVACFVRYYILSAGSRWLVKVYIEGCYNRSPRLQATGYY